MSADAPVWSGPARRYAFRSSMRAWLGIGGLVSLLMFLAHLFPQWGLPDAPGSERAARLVLFGLGAVLLLFRYFASGARAIELSSVGVMQDPGGEARTTPWTSVVGARRSLILNGTSLVDAQGRPAATIDDLLDGADDCLERIADHAALVTPPLPVSRGLGGLPTNAAVALAMLVLGALGFASGFFDWIGLAIFGALGLYYLWLARGEVLGVEIDEPGISLRRVAGQDFVPWSRVTACGFRFIASGRSRWVESYLAVDGVPRKFAPAGSAAVVLVALVRRRLRARDAGTS